MILVAFATGVGVTAIFGIGLAGATRAVEMAREGRPLEMGLFGTVAAIAFAIVTAAIAFGIYIMIAG